VTVKLDKLIGLVSPSRLETAQVCMAKFCFRYIEREPEPWNAAMQFGTAFDETVGHCFTAKKATRLPTIKRAQEMFASEWDYAAGAIEVWQGEQRGALLDIGVKCVAAWQPRIGRHIKPLAVQEHLTEQVKDPISGDTFALQGFLDIRGTRRTVDIVADTKTSKKAYSQSVFQKRMQPVSYTLLTGLNTFEYHVVTRTKKPAVQVLRATITDDDRRGFLIRAGILRRNIAHAYRTGDWLPNRDSNLCSKRYCAFWSKCEARFGGSVPA